MQRLIPTLLAALLPLGSAQAADKTVAPPETVDKPNEFIFANLDNDFPSCIL